MLHCGAYRSRGATRPSPPPLKARTPGPHTSPDQYRTAPGSTSSVGAPVPTLYGSPHLADAPPQPPKRIPSQPRWRRPCARTSGSTSAHAPAPRAPPWYSTTTPPGPPQPPVHTTRAHPPRPNPPAKAKAPPRDSDGSAGRTRSSGDSESWPEQSPPSRAWSTGPARGRWRTAACSQREGECHRPH